MTTDDDGIAFVDKDSISSWLDDRSASESSLLDDTSEESLVTGSLKEVLWQSLRDSIGIAVIGSGLHGIREDDDLDDISRLFLTKN